MPVAKTRAMPASKEEVERSQQSRRAGEEEVGPQTRLFSNSFLTGVLIFLRLQGRKHGVWAQSRKDKGNEIGNYSGMHRRIAFMGGKSFALLSCLFILGFIGMGVVFVLLELVGVSCILSWKE